MPTSAPTTVPAPTAAPTAVPQVNALNPGSGPFAGTWRLTRDHDAFFMPEASPGNPLNLLSLGADGSVSGNVGCTWFTTTVGSDGGGRLVVTGPITTDHAACAETWQHRTPDFNMLSLATINSGGELIWSQNPDEYEENFQHDIYSRQFSRFDGPVTATAAGIYAGNWQLISSDGQPLPAGTGPKLFLQPDGTMTGTIECSTFSGRVVSTASTMRTTGEIVTSPGPCGGGTAGNVPLDTLRNVRIENGRLIWSTDGGVELIFAAI